MKPQTLSSEKATVSGNLDVSNTIVMDISIDDRAHLMSMLTNMYSDRVLACVREYATNARDAHIMAGIPDRAIQISLPTALSQFYKVRDFGEGLDIGGLTKYYARYGASAKRKTDDTNGTLGIGCKAALTYSPTFSVTSIHQGVKYSVAITMNADGVGELNVVSTTPTSDPSGVEVAIPVKRNDFYAFESKAKGFFRWWDDSHFTGIRNAEKPDQISDLGGSLFTYSRDAVAQDLIVMGGVAYPIPYDGGLLPLDNDNDREFSIVYFAAMSEVVFAPSREMLMEVPKTKRAVDAIRERVRKSIEDSVAKDVNNAFSPINAMLLAAKFRETYSGLKLNFQYKGVDVPDTRHKIFNCPEGETDKVDWQGKPVLGLDGKPAKQIQRYPFHFISPRTGSSESQRYGLLENYWGWSRQGLTNFPKSHAMILNAPREVTAQHRKVIRDFHEIRGEAGDKEYREYIFVPGPVVPGKEWLKDVVGEVPPEFEWEAVKKTVRDWSKTTASLSDPTKYEFYDKSNKYEKRQIKDAEKVLVTTSAYAANQGYSIAQIINLWADRLSFDGVAVMPSNRWAKFLREHPNARLLHHEVAKHWQACYDGLSKEQLRHWHALDNAGYRNEFINLDPKLVLDSDLVGYIEAMKDDVVKRKRQDITNGVENYRRVFYYGERNRKGSLVADHAVKDMMLTTKPADEKAKAYVAARAWYADRVNTSGKPGIITEVVNALYPLRKV